MCNFENGFILCKCQSVQDKNRKSSSTYRKYSWILYDCPVYQDRDWMDMTMGRCEVPVHNFDEQLSSVYFKEQLNARNCFDFEHIPGEGENLILIYEGEVMNQYRRKFMSFVFRDGQWVEEVYDLLDVDMLRKIENGIIAEFGDK